MIDEGKAGLVRELPEKRCPDSAQPESEPKEKAGNTADISRQEFLCVDQNRGKRRGEDDADKNAEDARPKQIDVRQNQTEGENAKNGAPDDVLAADFVADGSADESPGGDGAKKKEEMQLGIVDGNVKLVYQIEGVVAHQAGQIKKLREHQRHEDRQG